MRRLTYSKPHLYLLHGLWRARCIARNPDTGSSYLAKHAGATPAEAYENLTRWFPENRETVQRLC